MLGQHMFTHRMHTRRALALLALIIVAALAVNTGANRGIILGAEEPSLTISSTTAGAITETLESGTQTGLVGINLVTGQEVTYRLETNANSNTPPSDVSEMYLDLFCRCNRTADVVSYTTKAGTPAATKVNLPDVNVKIEGAPLPADAFPIEFTLKGLRSTRLTSGTGGSMIPTQVGRAYTAAVYWKQAGQVTSNGVVGRIIVRERSHSVAESMMQYVSIDNAADVMKGGTISYPVRLSDRQQHPVNATQNIHLVITTSSDYTDTYDNPVTPLNQHVVMIPMGASSTTISVQSRADVQTRPVERVYIKAYLRDHPDGVTFFDPYEQFDAIGKVVEGTAFSFLYPTFEGGEGSIMPIPIRVEGNVNVGEFVLRLNFSFWAPRGYSKAADASDLGNISQYDCRINPTTRGEHLINLPLHQDNMSEPSEAFVMQLSLVSAPVGVTASATPNYYFKQRNLAYGYIHEQPPYTYHNLTSDCVAVEAQGSVPSSQPLRSPISLGASAIVLGEGSSFSYDVTLDSDPGEQRVTVTPISSDEDAIESPTPISFDSGNWDQPQQVIVSAAADSDDEDDVVMIGHRVEGLNDAPVGPAVFATVTEQPTVGLDLRQPTQRSFGDQPFFAYWIRLDRQPSSDLEVELAPASDSVGVQLHTNSLSFTTENWDRYQIVVLKPLDSSAGSELKITHSATTHIINSGESVSATISGS